MPEGALRQGVIEAYVLTSAELTCRYRVAIKPVYMLSCALCKSHQRTLTNC